MRPRWWRVVLVVSSLAAGGVASSSSPASASETVAGSATVANYFGDYTGPPQVFLMTGPLPPALQPSVGNLNTACYGPSYSCDWLAQDPTGATLGDGTCTFTTYTVAAITNPVGKWSLACTGTTAQGAAASFDFTVNAAITMTSSSPGGNGGSSYIQYNGAYEAS